jgi:hypothetical protein
MYEIVNLNTGEHHTLFSSKYLDALREAAEHECVNTVDKFAVVDNDTYEIKIQFNK